MDDCKASCVRCGKRFVGAEMRANLRLVDTGQQLAPGSRVMRCELVCTKCIQKLDASNTVL